MLCPVLANPPKTKGRVPALRLPGQPPKTHPRTLQRPTRMRLACLGACIVISPEAIKVPSGPWNHRSPRGDGDVKTVAALNVMEIAPFRMMDRWCSDMLDLVPRARLHRKNLGVINKPTAIVRSRPAPGFEQPSCRVLGQALGDNLRVALCSREHAQDVRFGRKRKVAAQRVEARCPLRGAGGRSVCCHGLGQRQVLENARSREQKKVKGERYGKHWLETVPDPSTNCGDPVPETCSEMARLCHPVLPAGVTGRCYRPVTPAGYTGRCYRAGNTGL